MPELPEVEAARRAIEEHCLGKQIVKVTVADDPKVIDGVSSSDFEASLAGKTIVAALRKGKNLWLRLDSPPFPSFQFGMAGAIYTKGVAVTKYKRSAVNAAEEWPSKYSKVFMELDDGLELSFTDKRRFAKVRLLEDPSSVPPIALLGPDALLEFKQVDEFVNSLTSKRIGIKALLLDQSFISGIGNWVADEVLYQARIHPLQAASGLSQEKSALLHKCIKEVLGKALEVGADSSNFPSDWIFHSRDKKPGKAYVNGQKIEFITAGGRTTAFVPTVQKLSGSALNEDSCKPTKSKTGGRAVSKKDGKEKSKEDGKDTEVQSTGKQNGSKGRSKKGRAMTGLDSMGESAEDSKDTGSQSTSKRSNLKGRRVKVNEVDEANQKLRKAEGKTRKKVKRS